MDGYSEWLIFIPPGLILTCSKVNVQGNCSRTAPSAMHDFYSKPT